MRLASISHISNALVAEGGVSHLKLNRLALAAKEHTCRSPKEDGLERRPRLTSESTLALLAIGSEACTTLPDVLAGVELVDGSAPISASLQIASPVG